MTDLRYSVARAVAETLVSEFEALEDGQGDPNDGLTDVEYESAHTQREAAVRQIARRVRAALPPAADLAAEWRELPEHVARADRDPTPCPGCGMSAGESHYSCGRSGGCYGVA